MTLSVQAKVALFSHDERVLVTLQGQPGLWDPATGRLLADYRHASCGVARISVADGGHLTVTSGPRAMVISSWPEEGRSTLVPESADYEIGIASQESGLAVMAGGGTGPRWVDLRHPTDNLPLPSTVGSGIRLSPNGEALASLKLQAGRAISVARRGGDETTLLDPRPARARQVVGSDHGGRRWAVLRVYLDGNRLAIVDTATARWQTLEWNIAEADDIACDCWPRDDRVVCSNGSHGLQVFSTADGQPQWSCPKDQYIVMPSQDPQWPLLACIRPTGLEIYDPATAAHRWLTR